MKKNFGVLFALSFATLAMTCISSSAITSKDAAINSKTSTDSETTIETKEEKKEESSVNDLYNAELSLHSSEKNCTRYRNYGFKQSHLHELVFDEMSDRDILERMYPKEEESVWKEIDSRTISDKPALFADMKDHRDFKHHADAAGGRLIYIPFKIKIHVPAEVYQNSYVTFDFTQRYDPNWANVPYRRTYSEYIFSFGCGEDDSIVSDVPIEQRRPEKVEFAGKGHVAPLAVDVEGVTEVRNTAAAQVRSCSVSGGKIKGATRERDVTFYFGYLLSVTAGSSGIAEAQRMKLCDNWVRLDNIKIGEPPIALIEGSKKEVFKDVNSAITAFNATENAILQIDKDVEISKPTEITGSGKITTNGHKFTTTAPITINPKQKNNGSSEQNLKFENVYLDICAGSGEHPYTVTTGIDSKSHVVFDNCDFNNTKTNNCALYVDAGNDVLINNCHFSKEGFESPYIVLAKNESKGDGNTVTFKNSSFYEHNTNLIVDTTNDSNPTIKFSGNTISSRYNISRDELPIKLGSGIDQTEALNTKTCLYGSENGVTGFYTGESVIKVMREGDKKFDINYVLAKNILASSSSKFTCSSLADNTTLAYYGYNNDLVVTKSTSGKAVAQIVPVEDTTQFKETCSETTYKHETKELSLESTASHSLYVATYDSTSKTYEIPTSVTISITLSAGTGKIELVDGQDYTYYTDTGLIDFTMSSLAGKIDVSVVNE